MVNHCRRIYIRRLSRFEGAEKIYEYISSRTSGYYNRKQILVRKSINFRKGKIKAAIVTDFIISRNCNVHGVEGKGISTQIIVVTFIAFLATVGSLWVSH
jgi:predicted DNA repair protein MutK